jgi:hypothetical protein
MHWRNIDNWEDAFRDIEGDNQKEDYLISDIIQGYSHIYEITGSDGKPLCDKETIVKESNLKQPPADIIKLEHKLCDDCFKEYSD